MNNVSLETCNKVHTILNERLDKIEYNHLAHIQSDIQEIKISLATINEKVNNVEEFKKNVWTFMTKIFIITLCASIGINVASNVVIKFLGL